MEMIFLINLQPKNGMHAQAINYPGSVVSQFVAVPDPRHMSAELGQSWHHLVPFEDQDWFCLLE